jgi:hypothetical protein
MLMKEPMLIFETDPQLGMPKLQAINGAAKSWTPKDLCLLEEELRPRYDSLVREGKGTVKFKGNILFIKKKDGDQSRQPTLELHSVEWCTPQLAEPCAVPHTSTHTVPWCKGFLADIDRLFASSGFNALLPAEKAMLDVVRKELTAYVDRAPSAEMTLLILVSILVTAEQVCRTLRPNEPRPYTYALSGIGRVLSEEGKPQTPWGDLPKEASPESPPSWLGRFFGRG